MPFYDYQCKECTEIFETQHSMFAETPTVLCLNCGSGNTEKLISSVNVNIRTGNTLLKDKFKQKQVKKADMKQELKQDFGVHEVTPTGKGMTYEKVYKDIKDNSNQVKDVMKEKRKQSYVDALKKQKEEKEKFSKIRKKRIEEVKQKRAQEGYDKRKISGEIITKKEVK